MAEDELEIVRLRNDFYRDGFNKVFIALLMIIMAILLLVTISVSLYLKKPDPVTFVTDNDWRVLPPVPLDQPYLISADLIQWVSDVLPKSFTFDFINYQKQLDALPGYFTAPGWKKFLELVNIYANQNIVQTSRSFLMTSPRGAPIVINQGLLPEGNYGWWIQMPLVISSSSANKNASINVVLKALVIRVPTLNNLSGIAIDNIVISKEEGGAVSNNG